MDCLVSSRVTSVCDFYDLKVLKGILTRVQKKELMTQITTMVWSLT